MMKKLDFTKSNGNDANGNPLPLGDSASVAFGKAETNFSRLDRAHQFSTGGLAKGVVGNAGDSMAGYATGPQIQQHGDGLFYGSPFFQLLTYRYCADITLDTRDYYVKDGSPEVRLPAFQRGHGFAKGSTKVSHFVDVQIPYILEFPPEFLFLSLFQNGGYHFQEGKDNFNLDLALAKENIPRLLDAGITIIMAGMYPHSNVGAGSDNAQLKHRMEHEMRNWAVTQPGLHYVPWLDRLKVFDPAKEDNGQLDWLPGTDAGDGLHSGAYGGWIQSEVLEPVFRKLFSEYQAPAFDLAAFDPAVSLYGNVLGAPGSMAGTGGLLNGVVNANIPAGVEVTYPTNLGVTLTPTIFQRNGKPALRLAIAGTQTPTGDGNIEIAVPFDTRFSDMPMEVYAEGRWVNALNWNGLLVGQGFPIRNEIGAVSGFNRLPFALDRPWRARTPRPRLFSATGATKVSVISAFVNGVPISGALEVDRIFFGRNDNVPPAAPNV